ncbi:kinase-like domain-containing protein [Fimicolochytrium jonesii]|uniref:kinase-like domain-containing protein n=1 Tax=Fimicolochytrium jonesii TaxID=1396493 RepID=UPI0022FDF621|nr:kinase-like domain-containing protein [Fimicolochytrium jonesii]KAI8825103.1 kinase-like domain-containing protein [Fimicolochytrium jonesii]
MASENISASPLTASNRDVARHESSDSIGIKNVDWKASDRDVARLGSSDSIGSKNADWKLGRPQLAPLSESTATSLHSVSAVDKPNIPLPEDEGQSETITKGQQSLDDVRGRVAIRELREQLGSMPLVNHTAAEQGGDRIGFGNGAGKRNSRLSVPDVSKVDFVIGGPGIGASRATSTETNSRRASGQMGSGTTQPAQSRSNTSSRRPTFQGKAALMSAVQRRMSAVDVSQLGMQVPGANADGEDASGTGHEKPIILMYPRKEVLVGGSLSDMSSRSRHGSMVTDRKDGSNGSRSGSLSLHQASHSSMPRSGSLGGLSKGTGSRKRNSGSQSGKLAASVSMGALAAAGSARATLARQARESAAEQASGSRYASSSLPRNNGRNNSRSNTRLAQRANSDEQVAEKIHPNDAVRPSPLRESVVSQPETGTPSQAFHSRAMSVVGDMDESHRANPDYYEYLMLCQRHASNNFIHKIDSSEVVWRQEATKAKLIDRYLLGEQIGKGAFGKVKEGLCSETLQRVAIKVINKKRLRKMPNGVENVIREIKLLRRLKHRNTIRLIDVYCKVEDEEGNFGVFNWFSSIEEEPIAWRFEDGTEAERDVEILKWYLVFEYCPCALQTLLEQADEKRLPIPRAHRFFVQLIEGLAYVHSQGVVHRDIKAGNMLITPDNVLKISDFGIAEQFSTYSDAPMDVTSFAGTHQFLSPEVAEGVAQARGEAVDVWACGVTLFNMLTGRYPFEFDEDGNLLTLYEKIVEGNFEMPAEFQPDLKNLLSGMLDKNPKTRLTTDQILAHPWARTFFHESLRPPEPILAYPSAAEKAETPTPTDRKSVAKTGSGQVLNVMVSSKSSGLSNGKATEVPAPPLHITPCETTLVPYLEQLFADEIEEELKTVGKLEDLITPAGSKSSEDVKSPQKHHTSRLPHWLSHIFSHKKPADKKLPSDQKHASKPSSKSPSAPAIAGTRHMVS